MATIKPIRRLLTGDLPALNILELGPGTGAITAGIASLMREEDHLDLVELNPLFFKILSKRINQPNISLYNTNVLQFDPDKHYDVIISSIPYESLPSKVTTQIWKKKLALSSTDCLMVHYKYLNPVAFRSKYEKLMVRNHLIGKEVVWRNIPPATVYSLQVRKSIIFAA